MLFDISTGASIPVPTWAVEILEEDFPDFFNGKPVKISVLPHKMARNYKVGSNDKSMTPRLVIEPPIGTVRKARGYVLDPETGQQVMLQYSTSYPRNTSSGISFPFPGGYVTLEHGMTIQPSQLDLLFYVHFLCPSVEGNMCEYADHSPFYKYDRPDVDAKTKIEKVKKERNLENLIYFDTPYDSILKAINGLGLKTKETEEENRVMLHDAMSRGTETFRNNAFEILNSTQKKQEVKSEETIHELVNRLSSEGFIKNEDGIWYLRDRRGDGTKWLKNPFFESTGEKDAFALIDHLKVNEELLGKLRKL
jgi:hypothetical protein